MGTGIQRMGNVISYSPTMEGSGKSKAHCVTGVCRFVSLFRILTDEKNTRVFPSAVGNRAFGIVGGDAPGLVGHTGVNGTQVDEVESGFSSFSSGTCCLCTCDPGAVVDSGALRPREHLYKSFAT